MRRRSLGVESESYQSHTASERNNSDYDDAVASAPASVVSLMATVPRGPRADLEAKLSGRRAGRGANDNERANVER